MEEALLGVTRVAARAADLYASQGAGHLAADGGGATGRGSAADLCLFAVAPGERPEPETLVQYSGGYGCVLTVTGGRVAYADIPRLAAGAAAASRL